MVKRSHIVTETTKQRLGKMEEKKNKKNGSGNGDETVEELNKAKKRAQKHT